MRSSWEIWSCTEHTFRNRCHLRVKTWLRQASASNIFKQFCLSGHVQEVGQAAQPLVVTTLKSAVQRSVREVFLRGSSKEAKRQLQLRGSQSSHTGQGPLIHGYNEVIPSENFLKSR